MPSSTHRDPDGVRDNDALMSWLIPMAENLLTDTWDLVMGNHAAGRYAKLTAKDMELSSQLTEISLRISEIEIKIDRERNLQAYLRQSCKDFTNQRRHLTNWLKSCERADELEDACLADDLELAILVDLETKSVIRWCRSSAYDELVYGLYLVDIAGRMTTYVRQYEEVVLELMVLNNSITSIRLATLKRQQQDLRTWILAAEAWRRA